MKSLFICESQLSGSSQGANQAYEWSVDEWMGFLRNSRFLMLCGEDTNQRYATTKTKSSWNLSNFTIFESNKNTTMSLGMRRNTIRVT